MTVSSSISTQTFTCNGSTTVFTCPFRVLEASEAVGYLITVATNESVPLVSGADFSVTGVGAANAIVTTTATYSSAYRLNFRRRTQRLQLTDYRDNDPFPAESHENALDRLTHIAQENDTEISRALLVPEPESGVTLPNAADRAELLLGFDSSGAPIAVAPSSGSAADLAMDLVSSSVASKGAGQIGYDASLAYGESTVGRKLQDRIDVCDAPFLASPSNSAAQNNAANVLALAQCSAGKTLFFSKPGLYKVSATVVDAAIVLPVGVDLEMAPGAWLTADSSFGSFIAPLGRNRIKCNIDGAGYPASGGVTGTWTLENAGIRAYFSAPIGRGAADVILDGCRIKNVTYAVQTEGAQRWRILNSTFERCKLTAVLMGFLPSFDCANNIISSNAFDDLGDYAVAFWQVTGASGEVAFNAVTNNWARNCNQATNGYAFGVEQGDVTRQHHMLFAHNFYVTAGSGAVTVGGITISTCRDSAVIGNVLSCPATTQAKGINCVSSLNCTISGNMLDGWTDTAIDTDGSDGITLDGNAIRDCGGASSTYPAVRLAATLDTSNIRMLGGSVTIGSGYALSGTAVAAVRALTATGKTVKNITVKGVTFTNPNDRGVSLDGISGAPILNAEVSGCTFNGIGSATFFTREVVAADYVNDLTVSDNVVLDAKRGIAATNCVGGTLARNEFKGSTTISTLYDITGSTDLRIRDDIVSTTVTTALTPTARLAALYSNSARGCTSIVTEATGTTGAIASGATVTHGMFTTPTYIAPTPISAAVACAVTARSTTTFTITFAGGGTQSFDWQAAIR